MNKKLSDKLSKTIKNKIARYRNQVVKFNAELQEYFDKTESHDLPDIETTCIGYSDIDLAEIFDFDGIQYGFVVKLDGLEVRVEVEYDPHDGEYYITGYDDGLDSLSELLKWERRRIRKGYRIFASENPDRELERDEDE